MRFKFIEALQYPCPKNLSALWNYGFLALVFLLVQILTGLLISLHYNCCDWGSAYLRVVNLRREVPQGWLFRSIHINGASFYFIIIFIHMLRGLYYSSFSLYLTWVSGVLIFILSIAVAFFGYVLPWGQISFWGATVITNFFSVIPILGNKILLGLWGGFSVSAITLNRFYSFHFFLPFVLLGLVLMHVRILHMTGSTNPLGVKRDYNKIRFFPYFFFKDTQFLGGFIILFVFFTFFAPWVLGDPENFIYANPLVTPVHIRPEWYFLFLYAILRAVPSKSLGIIIILLAIFILFIFTLFYWKQIKGAQFYPLDKIFWGGIVVNLLLISWVGGRPVEYPYDLLGQILTLRYFRYFLVPPLLAKNWDFWLQKKKGGRE